MSKRKTIDIEPIVFTEPPVHSVEEQENRMIMLATNLAEQQLRDGTASSQVITHYLKLGSTKEKLEKEKLIEENKLLKAKTEALESAKSLEESYIKAVEAMKRYSGQITFEIEED